MVAVAPVSGPVDVAVRIGAACGFVMVVAKVEVVITIKAHVASAPAGAQRG